MENPWSWNYHILLSYFIYSKMHIFFPNFNIFGIYLTIDGVLDLMKYGSFILYVFVRVISHTRLTLLFPKELFILKYHCQSTHSSTFLLRLWNSVVDMCSNWRKNSSQRLNEGFPQPFPVFCIMSTKNDFPHSFL